MTTTRKRAPTTQDFDREFRAQLAQMTAGLAPTAFTTAWADWAMHLALSPAKQAELQRQADRKLDEIRGNITLALPHELRTPLNGIMGLAQILIEDYATLPPELPWTSTAWARRSWTRWWKRGW